jgi:uncharacterized membrane protein
VSAVVTEKLSKAKGAVPGAGEQSPLGDSLRRLTETVTSRAATSLTNKVTKATGRLTDYSSGNGDGGLLGAVTGAQKGAGRGAALGAVKGAFSKVAQNVKEKLGNALGGGGRGGGGKGGKLKVTNIVEEIDVGVPVDLAYDQWTRFTDFPGFMKKVENVEQISEEKVAWKAQVFWSHRTWESTILEQVPSERIVWRSKGAKGHVDGAVTFHELTPDLTRILVVLEYHPQGLFERTGNLWRAQGRRARLELKHFRRHVMTHGLLHQDEIEGWRGEIHDGEVVEPEQDEAEDRDEDRDDAEDRDGQEPVDEEQDEEQDEEPADDEEVDEEPADDEADDEADEEVDEEPDREEQPARGRRRRATAGRK